MVFSAYQWTASIVFTTAGHNKRNILTFVTCLLQSYCFDGLIMYSIRCSRCTWCYRGKWQSDTLAPFTYRVTDRKPSLEFLSADGE